MFYQVPVNPGKYPIVMWHGAGQFSKTWETTPDGREGFQNIFLRRRFAIYLIDQPRRGDAGRSTVETTIKPTPDEQLWFNLVTVSALIALNRPDQLRSHLARARRNGVTETELVQAITQLAFYSGWPNAIS